MKYKNIREPIVFFKGSDIIKYNNNSRVILHEFCPTIFL